MRYIILLQFCFVSRSSSVLPICYAGRGQGLAWRDLLPDHNGFRFFKAAFDPRGGREIYVFHPRVEEAAVWLQALDLRGPGEIVCKDGTLSQANVQVWEQKYTSSCGLG